MEVKNQRDQFQCCWKSLNRRYTGNGEKNVSGAVKKELLGFGDWILRSGSEEKGAADVPLRLLTWAAE